MDKYFYEYLKIVFTCFFHVFKFFTNSRIIGGIFGLNILFLIDEFWRKVRLQFHNFEKLFANGIFFN